MWRNSMKNLPTLQDLFNNSVFKIPDYQRGYSWENQHREDLLEDLELVNEKGHYTGTVVLKENGSVTGLGKKYTQFDLVDGQQRFTTIIILLDNIAKELRKINTEESKEIAEGITSIYIKEKGLGGSTIYKLELDDENNTYFKEFIIEDKNGTNRKIKSHDRLYDAKIQFQEYLDAKKASTSDYFLFLNSMLEKITQSLIFTLYKVEDNAEVGVIFEVMNDRGKPLSELEKVKNFLIYLTGKISEDDSSSENLVKTINNDWKEILENLSVAGMSKNEDEDRFLRLNYILNFYSNIHAQTKNGKRISKTSQLTNIYKQLKSYFKDLERKREYEKCYKEIENYVNSLKSTSLKLRDIINPQYDFAFQNIDEKRFKEDIQVVCSQVGRLDIRSNILVLLVSIYDTYMKSPDKILDLMKLCEIFAFRVYYIARWRSYSGQDRLYTLACDIYNERLSYEEIVDEIGDLTDKYAPEDEIEYHLTRDWDYYEWNGLKYFLYEYEIFKCRKEINRTPELTWEHLKTANRKDSIEHILPQSMERNNEKVPYWTERFSTIEHDDNIGKLGNLTLTTPSENSKLSNFGFDTKKEIYKDSVWHINKELKDYPEWTEKQIDEREKEIVKFAKMRWGFEREIK